MLGITTNKDFSKVVRLEKYDFRKINLKYLFMMLLDKQVR